MSESASTFQSGSYVIPGLSAMGGTFSQKRPNLVHLNGLLIDWLTLRIPLDDVGHVVHDRVRDCLGSVVCTDADGVIKWQKRHLDVDKLRSDSQGLYWAAQSDGKQDFLVIAASPASLKHKVNVFGSLDIRAGAESLRMVAMQALNAVLPSLEKWQCRRIDITGNYALPDDASVRQALRQLLNTDGVRRKAGSHSRGGDTVYWSPNSDISKGKAYAKGAHLRSMIKRGKLTNADLSDETLTMADRLLRLEHSRCARWFRRFEHSGGHWLNLGMEALKYFYYEFFGPLTGGLEVKDMGREQIVNQIESGACVSHQQALQAFATYRNIKADGFEETKASMALRTWFRHIRILRKSGFSDAQLCAGNVVPFQAVRILLAQPVSGWADLRAA